MTLAVEKKRNHKKLGFDHIEAAEMIVKLDQLLINLDSFNKKLQQFHWTVIGPDFFELHDAFESLYKKTDEHIDEVAERIRVFGHYPTSDFSNPNRTSSILIPEKGLSSEFMMREVVQDIETLLGFLIEVANAASNNGDVGTVTLMGNYLLFYEKMHWQYRSWLRK
ncbi:MAG: DNA starvation/stationary phase protection protein [Flavobacteriales bacterium]|nr:DNA starvation/stationary phase protection protein [Flavobacteriales bacterium]